ncbi:ABC transporter ATP-binding protein [Shewanella youngdeokensis]|uniref:ABC transporter ATP-binding protein n=1 Tax=Shewanella youngdeokensis TaxID=2999068 RepID=A0ABZ0K1A2_9GAMM|nr:ABC transporter ATP-binding protein [Shewanella sp. DAU334]
MSESTEHPLLQCSGLTFSRVNRLLLDRISLEINPGEVVALLGPNGAGKSTLMRLLLGLEDASAGEVLVDGKPLQDYNRRDLATRVAYVPQSHVSPFPYSVRQVVALGRLCSTGLLGAMRPKDHLVIDEQLQRLQIFHLAERPYTEISGGERQLVLLARALAQEATLLLLDEPASALDFGHQARLLMKLKQLSEEGLAVVMTTHHPHHARMIADRALLLRDGQLLDQGKPQEVLNRSTMRALYGISELELDTFAAAGWEL